jgi:hypothetical protein
MPSSFDAYDRSANQRLLEVLVRGRGGLMPGIPGFRPNTEKPTNRYLTFTQCASEILPDDKIPIFIHLSFNHDKRGRFPAFSTLVFHFTTLHSTGTTKTKWKIPSKRAHHQTMFQNSLKILQSLQKHLQEEPLYLSMARKHTLLHGRLSRFCWLWRQLSFLFHS